MDTKPTIVIELAQLRGMRHGDPDDIPHVRVCMFEPREEKEEDRCGPAGVMNRKADFRWFLPDDNLPKFLTENFSFEPSHTTKRQRLDESAFEIEGQQYIVNLDRGSCQPRLDWFVLGTYVVDGVEHNVLGFTKHDLRSRVIAPGLKDGCAYELNTAMRYADEEFFDFLHLALTKHGFTTKYVKPSARKFVELECIPRPDGVKFHRYKCEVTGQELLASSFHRPRYTHPDYTVYAATKSEHPFALDTAAKMKSALQHTLDWTGQFDIDEDFKWIV